MSARLLAFDEPGLRAHLRAAAGIVATRDADGWRTFWSDHGRQLLHWSEAPELAEDGIPPADTQKLRLFLRGVAHGSALRRLFLEERLWHVHYPELSDDDAGFEVSSSEENEALGLHVFTTSAMPAGLEVLDENPDVATNWISGDTVQRLWSLELEEGMLAAVGSHLRSRRLPFGTDLLAVRELLDWAAQRGAALYLWSPGT